MTEKKQLREQVAIHSYKQSNRQSSNKHESVDEIRRSAIRNNSKSNPQKGARESSQEAPRALRRVVSIPEADPSTAWNTFERRREELRRTHSSARRYVGTAQQAPIARTFAQTGMYASSGRMRALRVLPQRGGVASLSTVPARSGRKELRRLRHNWFLRLLSFLFIGVIVVLTTSFALTSNAFRIAQVIVVGTHNNTLIGSIQRMGMQGQNIFLVNIASLAERIDASSLVASTTISKQLPNQLTVTVTERVPVLLWQTAHGVYSVDSQGIVIASASEMPGTDRLLTIVDTRDKGPAIQAGTHLSESDIAFAVDIFHRLPRITGVATFKLRYDGSTYAVESPDGWLAYLGNAHDTNPLDNKLTELQQILILAQQQELNLATIDVRYGLHPVYTLKH